MNDNMLGLKIVRINQGYTDLLEINGDQLWTKYIWDIRKDLENIENLDGSSAVLMLSSTDEGQILTIASLIGGRASDCISAWIYIPATISITGKELVSIVDTTKNAILANERNDEVLTQLFSKSYASAPATKIALKSDGNKCAFRYYGQGVKYTLSELLKGICQPYYKNYKSVFLLDNSLNLRCLDGDNLTEQKVYSMIDVKSPGCVDDFTPYINGVPFTDHMYAFEGDVITIEWQREGYLTLKTETTIKSNTAFSYPSPSEYTKLIPYNAIMVLDDKGHQIDEYQLIVADSAVKEGSMIPVREAIAKSTLVEVKAEGFDTFRSHCDLTQPCKVKLEKAKFKFLIPLKDGSYYPINLSANSTILGSPVNGYEVETGRVSRNEKNYLRYMPNTNIKPFVAIIIALVLGLLVGIGIGFGLSKFGNKKPTKSPEPVTIIVQPKTNTTQHEASPAPKVNSQPKVNNDRPKTDKPKASVKTKAPEEQAPPKKQDNQKVNKLQDDFS